MRKLSRWAGFWSGILLIFLAWTPAYAHDDPPDPTAGVHFDQKLNAQVPLDLVFRDEAGRPYKLSQAFNDKPVVLMFAYYNCPMLCSLALSDLASALKAQSFDLGDQYQVITVSMDAREGPGAAATKKAEILPLYGRPGGEAGWHFLTGDETSIDALAGAVGFQFVYVPEQDDFAHPTGIMVLTPQGRISRYLMGLDYSSRELRLGLVEASQKKIGTPVDQVFLLCFHYNPVTGRYDLLINNVIRLAALGTALILAGLVLFLLWRERQSRDRLVKMEEGS